MDAHEAMRRIDTQLAHVWMVRAFLKHAPETETDEELAEIHRELYDAMLALGGPLRANNADDYLKMAHKKLARLQRATAKFQEIQPLVSTHTNFQMAAQSLGAAVAQVGEMLAQCRE